MDVYDVIRDVGMASSRNVDDQRINLTMENKYNRIVAFGPMASLKKFYWDKGPNRPVKTFFQSDAVVVFDWIPLVGLLVERSVRRVSVECEVACTDKSYSKLGSLPESSRTNPIIKYEIKLFFSPFSITIIFIFMYSLRSKKNIYHFFHYIIL